MRAIVVTGTDTGVGKTVFAAGLAQALDAAYWKPVQAGCEPETDRAVVARLAGLAPARLVPECYILSRPLSPHRAAELDGIAIDVNDLTLPSETGGATMVVVEGAGGVLVPMTRECLQIDLFARWGAPAVVCARTSLGTINHTLLTIEALRCRAVPILGLAFIGEAMPDSEQTICAFAQVRRLGRLPFLDSLDAPGLKAAFAASFRCADFDDGN